GLANDGVARGLDYGRQMRTDFLSLPALSYVPNRAGDQEPAVWRTERAQADLSRELGAVFAPAEQVQAGAHRPRARILEEAVTVVSVRPAHALRQKHLDRLAQEFLPRVTKQALELGVDQDNVATAVDGDDRIGSGFEQTAQHYFGSLTL